MRRETIVLIIFIVIAGAVIGLSQYFQSQPPIEFTVAVNSLSASWLRDSVQRFNNTNPSINTTQRIHFNVVEESDITNWQEMTWTPQNHPAAWIPSTSTALQYTTRYRVHTDSLARSPLVWGGYASRVTALTANGTQALDWPSVQDGASREAWSQISGGQSSWNFVKLAFGAPDQNSAGLGALFSAAASFHESPNLSGEALRNSGFRNWLSPVIESVPNFITLGTNPVSAMSRNLSVADVALLPESQWLLGLNGLLRNEDVIFSYPAYQYTLDFPVGVWATAQEVDPTEYQAVDALVNWLLSDAEQAHLAASGLRPAHSEPSPDAALFVAAQDYGIQLNPDYGETVSPPSRTDAQGLIQWFRGQVR